jgi:hypothetical protein
MHQHQLLSFATKFGYFNTGATSSDPPSFTAGGDYVDPETFTFHFLSPVKKRYRKLQPSQLRHLQEHYKTIHSINDIHDDELINMDDRVQVWHRCRQNKTIYHCAEYQSQSTKRLSHLTCIQQSIDRNATRSALTHPEVMRLAYFYVYIQFFGVHTFRGQTSMLMYSQYRKVDCHNGLVQDMGAKNTGFQDVTVLSHLCARVQGHGGKIYFVDDQNVMEERLLQEIRIRKRPRQ